MRCQAVVPGEGGSTGMCSSNADYAHVLTPWLQGGARLYVCASHQLPRGACHATYYVGNGSIDSRVVPIEALRMRRLGVKAR